MYEYKTASFNDPQIQDETMNDLAEEGWEPHLMAAMSAAGGATTRETIIIVFRREKE